MLINKLDNVDINLENGHKYALRDIKAGENIIKYGNPIGHAIVDIAKGEHVHNHNIKTNLSGNLEYRYEPHFYDIAEEDKSRTFMGYVRENGDVGIRNDVWIVVTVGCVNKVAEQIAKETGALHFPHPFGCSQLGDDQTTTQLILRGLVNHPNAGGVLVLGLGCENNNIPEMQKILGQWDGERIRFLNVQDCEDEIAEGVKIIEELKAIAKNDVRKPVPVSQLKIGLKCGGSDGYSGITGNPVAGLATDRLCAMGASAVLTEVPEMFGAETVLFSRCTTEEVFRKGVDLINNFKEYFISHNQPVSENPSPGNREGGITTLEEKSLGCIQKGGHSPVTDVIDYGETVKVPGVTLLNGPGNDIVSITNLAAAGCHLILFTTGRGTPLGGAVPTIKISTNNVIAAKKPHWIDFNAFGENKKEISEKLLELIKETADGKETKNEIYGCREIAIFKDGVTL